MVRVALPSVRLFGCISVQRIDRAHVRHFAGQISGNFSATQDQKQIQNAHSNQGI